MRLIPVILFLFLFVNASAQDSLNVAFVKLPDGGPWQLIDDKGKVLADSLFEHDSLAVLECSEGMVLYERGGKYGYFNLKDSTFILPQYDSASRFSQSKALVSMAGRWTYIDHGGHMLAPYIDPNRIAAAFAEPEEPNCINGYCIVDIDTNINCKTPHGQLMLKHSDAAVAPWNDVNSFISGYILKYKILADKICDCQKLTPYYGFINNNGDWVIEPNYEQADIFSCGLASASVGTENIYNYGYIGTDGKWKIPAVFEIATRFRRISLGS